MSDLDTPARDIAGKLDAGKREEVSQSLSQYAQGLSRADFRQLVSKIDQMETDDQGLDLILKKDATGTPVNYTVLPSRLHASAREMARLMDAGSEREAHDFMGRTTVDIFNMSGKNADEALKTYGLWAMAVDAYEKDGLGIDVTVDSSKPKAEAVKWLKNPPPERATNDVSIPALIRGQEARQDSVIKVPKDSEVAKLYDKVHPSVVKIEATRPGQAPGTVDTSYGSGFFVGEDGLIATSNHTFYGFKDIKITTADGSTYTATVAGEDRQNDVALLKIKPAVGQKFPALEIEADSKGIAMQQELTAFGHAKGWDKTYISRGTVVGATEVSKVDSTPDPPEENPNKRVIALAAHGEDGGSGGPVVNAGGKVAGIAELASDSSRGQHIFVTQVEPLNGLIARYRAQEKPDKPFKPWRW